MDKHNHHSLTKIKWTISAIASIALVVRIVLPELKIDAISLGLIALAILPWLSPLIKSVELPGGPKIEFQQVEGAGNKIASANRSAWEAAKQFTLHWYSNTERLDPSLAMVRLRIEIEKPLRQLAKLAEIRSSAPLPHIVRQLCDLGTLDPATADGLTELITLGNQAAHGVVVSAEAADSAMQLGPRVIYVLEAKLKEIQGESSP